MYHLIVKHILFLVVAVACCTPVCVASAARAKDSFRHDGMFVVDGKPFFPLGIWVYNLDSNVMADLREHHFNTVVGGGFKPDDIPLTAWTEEGSAVRIDR